MGGSRSHPEKNWKIAPKLLYSSTDMLGVVYHVYFVCIYTLGAIQVLRNADGGGGVTFSGRKAL